MKVLIPVNINNDYYNYLLYGLNIAKGLNARADILYVTDQTSDLNYALEKLKEFIDTRIDNADYRNLIDERIVRAGDVIESIKGYCQNNCPELIIMGTKSNHNTSLKPLGSTTTRAIRSINCPLLAVPPEAPVKTPKKIVFAIDYQQLHDVSINQFIRFASAFDAEVILLHIAQIEGYFYPEQFANYKKTAEQLSDYDKMRFEFIRGEDIIEALDDFISQNNVDLLAMLARRFHLLDKYFNKSLTANMILHTRIPLLAFHE